MRTMYDPDPRTIKGGSLLAFAFVTVSSAFVPANFPGSWWLYCCFVALMFMYTVYMIYLCESFTLFTLSMFSSFVFSFGIAAAGLAHVALIKDLKTSSVEAAAVNIGLIVVMALTYAAVYFSRSKYSPFLIEGDRVSRISTTGRSHSSLGFILSISASALVVFVLSTSSFASTAVTVLGVHFSCVALMLSERDAIRGLRTLRAKEKKRSVSYTFMQIDEIREARNRWWLSRLFNWLASRRA